MLTLLIAGALLGADCSRCESSGDLADGAVVLQVAVNRAHDAGVPLAVALLAPHQHALGCPASPRTLRLAHLALGARAVLDQLAVPAWSRAARFYCGTGEEDTCDVRRAGFVGAVRHRFYRRHIGGARAAGARLALRGRSGT